VAPPRRSETVLVVRPEYPPPVPADPHQFGFWFGTDYITKGSRFEVGKLESVAAASCFVSAGGRIIQARGAEPEPFAPETAGHRFVLYPAAALEPDRWYALVLRTDRYLRVLDDAGISPSGGELVTGWAFFSGSAPRVVAAWLADEDVSPSLTLRFSEPLRLTRELCRGLSGAERDPLDRSCEAHEGTLAAAVQLRLTRAFTTLDIALPAATRGRGRSAGQSARLLGSASARRLTLGDFTACDGGRCWREAPPPELASASLGCGGSSSHEPAW
jgi:hypothetical protein